ncbi:MAG: dihydrofolate reductase [bacterium]
MRLSIIAALASTRVIGLNNSLPWHLPADLCHFQRMTMGHYLLMGRKTFESFDGLLAGRTIVVITRQADYRHKGVYTVHSLPDAIKLAAKEEEVFIAGGAEIYSEALSLADRMYLTLIHHDFEGDTLFPEFEENDWKLTDRKDYESDDQNPYPFSFVTYEKVARLR